MTDLPQLTQALWRTRRAGGHRVLYRFTLQAGGRTHELDSVLAAEYCKTRNISSRWTTADNAKHYDHRPLPPGWDNPHQRHQGGTAGTPSTEDTLPP